MIQNNLVWSRNIKLGTEKNGLALLRKLQATGHPMCTFLRYRLNQSDFVVSPREIMIELVGVRPIDLGFNKGIERVQLYAAIAKLGLKPCREEVGVQLRLQYTDQPIGEEIMVSVEPYVSPSGHMAFPDEYRLVQWPSGDVEIRSLGAGPRNTCFPERIVVFEKV